MPSINYYWLAFFALQNYCTFFLLALWISPAFDFFLLTGGLWVVGAGCDTLAAVQPGHLARVLHPQKVTGNI